MRLEGRQKGIALVATILTVLVVTMLVTLILARTLGEINTSRDDTAITQTLLLARAGANIGSAILQEVVRPELNRVVKRESSSTSRWAFDPYNGSGNVPDPAATAIRLAVVASAVQTDVSSKVCNDSQNLLNASGGQVRIRVYFTETACGVSLPNGVSLPAGRYYNGEPRSATGLGLQTYALPFVLVSEGVQGEHRRNVVIQGEYIVQIGRSSFARYGYFSNFETAEDGGLIYFTDETMIDGPVHTNERFALAYDPWFGGEVTSAGCTAPDTAGQLCRGAISGGATFYGQRVCTRYYYGYCLAYSGTASSFVKDEDMRPNSQRPSYANTTPIFSDGVAWDAAYIPMPANSNIQKLAAQGKDDKNNDLGTIGLSISGSLETLELRTVGADGATPTKNSAGKWTPAATYQIIKACTSSSCDIYRVDSQGVMMQCTPNVATATTITPGTSLPIVTNPNNSQVSEAQCFSSKWNPNSGYPQGNARNPWKSVTTTAKPFNGVVYVNGAVNRYKGPTRTNLADENTAAPAVAAFSQLTVAAESDVRITGDLRYERPPYKGSPTRNANRTVTGAEVDDLANNVGILGTFSAGGSLRVGSGNSSVDLNAPDNVNVHAILMSGKGKVEVENYNSGVARGKFKLLGGLIQNRRGAFGTFSGYGGSGTGFDRVYTYDKRMLNGLAPPYFPTTGSDEVKFVKSVTFGQREQVY